MSTITIRLDDLDVDRISRRVTEQLKSEIQPVLEQMAPVSSGPGVEILSRPEAAEHLGISQRHLRRLESEGKIPRRRRISPGRVVYLLHELEGLPAAAVLARSRRILNRTSLAKKLGLHPRTLDRLARRLPPANAEGEWYEREIDEWILKTPLA